MKKGLKMIKSFCVTEDGVTAIEYAIMASLIAVVIVGTVTLLGEQVDHAFQTVVTAFGG